MRREDPTTTPTPRKRMRVADGCVFHPGVTDAAKDRVLQVDEARRVAGLNSDQVAEMVKQQLFLHTQCA